MKTRIRYIAEVGLLLALAVIAAYVEMLIPLDLAVPGIKLGLANCVILFVLYRYGPIKAMTISLLRTMIIALLFTGPFVLLYSFSSAFSRNKAFSIYGVSMAGGVSHNLTQLAAASIILMASGTTLRYLLTYYMPILILAGIAAGVFNAAVADILLKRIPDKSLQEG